jgi:hypothetical protein
VREKKKGKRSEKEEEGNKGVRERGKAIPAR